MQNYFSLKQVNFQLKNTPARKVHLQGGRGWKPPFCDLAPGQQPWKDSKVGDIDFRNERLQLCNMCISPLSSPHSDQGDGVKG